MSQNALERIGLKQRIRELSVPDFGTVYLRELSVAEWLECFASEVFRQPLIIAMRAIVTQAGEPVLQTEEEAASLPPSLVHTIALECTKSAFADASAESAAAS